MGRLAVYYYKQGYNCSQCLLLSAGERFSFPVTQEMLRMCVGVNNGFGINGICSVLVAAMMVFGILFDGETAKRLRMLLLDRFHCSHSGFCCGQIKKSLGNPESCEEIIAEVACLVEELVAVEQSKACPCRCR